jgi:hypothetical protein
LWWHGSYRQPVNIHRQEDGARELLGVLGERRGDETARSAPFGGEVNDHL